MKTKLYFLLYLSILKTIRFNVHYFGIKTIFKPNVLISKNVKIKKLRGTIVLLKPARKCHIGFSTNYIYNGSKVKTIFYNEGTIYLSENLCVSKGSSIVVKKDGILTFGNNVHISQKTQIECHKKIVFGEDVVVSWDCLFIDSDTHPILSSSGEIINQNKPIIIGNKCWICCRSIILKGAALNDESILAAGSTLTKKIEEPNVIVVNNQIIKTGFSIRMDIDCL